MANAAIHTIDLPLLLGEPASWQYADIFQHVVEATMLGKLWAVFM